MEEGEVTGMGKGHLIRSKEDNVVNCMAAVLCVLVFIVTVYPVYYCLVYSFNEGADAVKGGVYLFPRKFTLENYKVVFQNAAIYPAFLMTILRSLIGTALTVLFSSMAAYALTKEELWGRRIYMLMGL